MPGKPQLNFHCLVPSQPLPESMKPAVIVIKPEFPVGCHYMSAIIYWQNPCKLPMSFRCVKAFMHAFSGRFSRASLEGISFNFFVCFILNVSIGSAPKRKNIDIQRNTRVGLGCHFTSNLLSCDHNPIDMGRELVIFLAPGGQHHSIASH